jgi:hypothetical protein
VKPIPIKGNHFISDIQWSNHDNILPRTAWVKVEVIDNLPVRLIFNIGKKNNSHNELIIVI